MSQEQRGLAEDTGPGGGERSEPEPGPAGRRRCGPRPGHARTHGWYTPEERRAAVEAFAKSGLSYEAFTRTWGVSKHALYLWIKRYRECGPQGLEHPFGTKPRGRKPLPEPVREEIVAVQRRFPDFGLRRVRDFLARFHGLRVSASGVKSAIVGAGLPRAAPAPRPRRGGTELVRRFERSRPGELWQTDITSFVLARPGKRVRLIAFLDDFSRSVVSWGLHTRITTALAGEVLLEGVWRFGKPLEVLTDQGPEYFAWRGKCGFQRLLVREGIKQVVARTHHPQTLGKCERLWKTVGEELWHRVQPRDLVEARERLAHFFNHYNHFRPHQGIDGLVPADRFFGAESSARRATEEAMAENELLVAVGERPRKAVFLFGQVGDEQVSLHGERGRLVVQTRSGAQEIEIHDVGISEEAEDDADDDGGGDGADDDLGGAGENATRAGAAACGPLDPAGLPDEGVLRRGAGGTAAPGAPAGGDHPGVLDGREDEAGGGVGAQRPADPRVADEPARGDGAGVRAPDAAIGEARPAEHDELGGQRPAQGGRAAAQGERAAEGADRGPAGTAGEPRPDDGETGVTGDGGRGDEAPEAEKTSPAARCAAPSERGCGPESSGTVSSGSSRNWWE